MNESKEVRRSFSSCSYGLADIEQSKPSGGLDVAEKTPSPVEKPKDEKRKEKKPGILSGLFKRKDRKSKTQSDDEDPDWLSKEIARQSPQPKVSSESIDGSASSTSQQLRYQPQRQTSKLQKPPPNKGSSPKRPSSREGPQTQKPILEEPSPVSTSKTEQSLPTSHRSPFEDTKRIDDQQPIRNASTASGINNVDLERNLDGPPQSSIESRAKGGVFSPIRDALRSTQESAESKPEKVKKAKERMAIDDFDSSPEGEQAPYLQQLSKETHPSLRLDDNSVAESPVRMKMPAQPVQPPALVRDSSSQDDRSISPDSPVSRSSTPELVEIPQEESIRDGETPASTAQSSSQERAWSGAHLRTYLEDDTEIRDLLIVVHDKSNVRAAGPDHPIAKSLCREETRRLDEISSRLDGLLNSFLARRSQARSTTK